MTTASTRELRARSRIDRLHANVLLCVMLAVIFLTDPLTPASFAHGMLYVGAVVFAMQSRRRSLILLVTLVAIGLVIIGYFLAPPAPRGLPLFYAYANRIGSILIIAATGSLAFTMLRNIGQRRHAELARSAAESALAESDDLLRMAGKLAGVGGWSVRLDDDRIRWSEEVARIHEEDAGYQPTLEQGLNYYAPEFQPRIRSVFQACIEQGQPYDEELQVISAGGHRIWVRVIGEPVYDDDDQIIGAHGAFMNIDSGKRLARRLTTTLESIADGFFMLDREWRFTFVNARAEQLLDRSRESLIGKRLRDAFPESSEFDEHYRQAVAEARPVNFEACYSPLDRWFQVKAYPSEEGLAVYFQDITQQRESRAQLRLLQAAIGRINDGVMITNAELVDPPGPEIVYVNHAFEQMTGYSAREVLGCSPRILQGPQTPRGELDRIRTAIKQREPVHAELINYRKDCSTFLMELDIVPITNASGQLTHWVSVQRDVTERHTLEQQLRQSERLKTVGQLTGGIAHDFNNLLTVIIGNTELLTERLKSDAALSEIAERIGHAAQRGADLTSQLLAFSRQQALEPRPVDINRLVLDMNRLLLGRTLDNQIRIELSPSEKMCEAMVDPSQLQNALLNLCLNARDALDDRGTVTIRTDTLWMDDEQARMNDIKPGKYAVIEVADTGHGIAAQELSRVIEPFYTTKKKGKGTGLGLSMVYGFVKQSRGHLAIESEVGRGTTVRMFLPGTPAAAMQAPQPVKDQHVQKVEEVEDGSESILLVEDDDDVRHFARQQLLGLGYQVKTARSGTEALKILEQNEPIDLLFTDIVMPGQLNGKQLAERAMKSRPDLKVLYTSGYSADEITHDGQLDSGVALLPKPYRRTDLAHKLRETLSPHLSAREQPQEKSL